VSESARSAPPTGGAPARKKRNLFRRRFARPGSPPGALEIPAGSPKPRIHTITFGAESIEERDGVSPKDARDAVRPGLVTWVDVVGIGDEATLRELGERFGVHPLALSDVANVGQRPKADPYGETLFCIVRMATHEGAGEFSWEQFSMFLGEGFVLTFQENPGDCLDPLRERIRRGQRSLRDSGPDFLATMLLDAIVDGYFPILESYAERLEAIETRVVESPERGVLSEIYRMKRDLMSFRRAAWPLRDVLNHLLRDGHLRLSPAVAPYLRDAADHVTQAVEVLESYRELTGSFVDVYLSSIANRTNDAMRVLTVISTIFIPLTFLAGVYGMNFDRSEPGNMPELGWPYGYLAFWAVSIALGGLLLLLFRRLGWLARRR
jgi:magnesium transporter